MNGQGRERRTLKEKQLYAGGNQLNRKLGDSEIQASDDLVPKAAKSNYGTN